MRRKSINIINISRIKCLRIYAKHFIKLKDQIGIVRHHLMEEKEKIVHNYLKQIIKFPLSRFQVIKIQSFLKSVSHFNCLHLLNLKCSLIKRKYKNN